MLSVVFENQTAFATIEDLLGAIKLATGLFDTGKTVDGVPYVVPQSISFAAMDQNRFEKWYEKALDVILTKIVPGIARTDLDARIQEILDGHSASWQYCSMAPKKKNTGKPYELLVQAIFQTIHDQTEVKTIEVRHNRKLKGLKATHQIDVYWEFEFGGIIHKVVVQTKDLGKPVEQGDIMLFHAVLTDLPGQPRGVFVTRTGYQQGALEFADASGISLFVLDTQRPRPNIQITFVDCVKFKANPREFQGKLSDGTIEKEFTLGVSTTVFHPVISNLNLIADKTIPEYKPDNRKISFTDFKFYGPDHEELTNLWLIIRDELAPYHNGQVKSLHIQHDFKTPTYSGPPATDSYSKLKAVAFDVEIQITYYPAHFKLSKFAQFVLHEVQTDKTTTFLGPLKDLPTGLM